MFTDFLSSQCSFLLSAIFFDIITVKVTYIDCKHNFKPCKKRDLHYKCILKAYLSLILFNLNQAKLFTLITK